MKLLLLLIIAITAGIHLNGRMPNLYQSAPALVTTVALAPTPTPPPPPTDAEVIQEIVKVFSSEDRHTIKKMIDVAYGESGLRWNAHNTNTNGSEDFGVFQINSVHTKRFGSEFKTDYKSNIQVAYKLFKQQSFNPWVVAHKLGYVR